jgi:hypothetical protein
MGHHEVRIVFRPPADAIVPVAERGPVITKVSLSPS